LASLPEGPGQTWMFELPLATSQGTAIAQFEIDHDGGAAGGAQGQPGWRVRFSIDIEPLGPVHVQLAAGVERAAVTVWAERPDGLLRLRSLGDELARALPADVRFQGGAPRPPASTPGQFVDQSS
jgi:Flagellar hook-length control protein FliK